ncbi:hypothetical protein MDS_2880 [Ectopseudomonas mendocina NK-01]|nr:hypothetical protein MDS_2880 [Pseudomonas mendocina NK-01]
MPEHYLPYTEEEVVRIRKVSLLNLSKVRAYLIKRMNDQAIEHQRCYCKSRRPIQALPTDEPLDINI